jgi:hypothetical protein
VFAVAVTVARPPASVVAVVELSVADAPLVGAENVTVSPGTGFPRPSVTNATSDVPNAVVTVVVCPVPLDTAIAAAVLGVFPSEKLAAVGTPDAVAVTAYVPAALFAVAVVVARPLLSVVVVVVPSAAEAPLVGDAKVTATPGTALPFES